MYYRSMACTFYLLYQGSYYANPDIHVHYVWIWGQIILYQATHRNWLFGECNWNIVGNQGGVSLSELYLPLSRPFNGNNAPETFHCVQLNDQIDFWSVSSIVKRILGRIKINSCMFNFKLIHNKIFVPVNQL